MPPPKKPQRWTQFFNPFLTRLWGAARTRFTPRDRAFGGVAFVALLLFFSLHWFFWGETKLSTPSLPPEKIATTLEPVLHETSLPTQLEMQLENVGPKVAVNMNYTLNRELQDWGARLVKMYQPEYAAIVVLDATTGAILTLLSYSRGEEDQNWALQARFPAASIFKIVTAAAAVDQGILSPESQIPFHGSNHTLYRRNVYSQTENRWTRYMTLSEAFARSVNTVFGKIGMFMLKPSHLEEYGQRFLFNRSILADFPVEAGRLQIPLESEWERAEIASGFNRLSMMSPVQGALIAASVANDGVMMRPYLVRSIRDSEGKRIYFHEPTVLGQPVRAETSAALRQMMQKTVQSGTSRSSFRDLVRRKAFQSIEFGGKTGSLTSLDPRGKCDWFVGYGRRDADRIAVSVLTVHGEYWRVKSSYLARSLLEQYFRARPQALSVAEPGKDTQ